MSFIDRIGAAFSAGITEAVDAVSRGAARHVPDLLGALFVLIVAWLTGRIVYAAVRRVLSRTSTQAHVDVLVARVARGVIWTVGAVVALAVAGVNVGALVTSLGLAGLTLGFALRDVFANSVAGVMLLVQRPFRIGDTIVVSGTEGVVTDVRVRDTVLSTPDGRVAFVPNITVFNGVVINLSAQAVRRFEIAVWTPVGAEVEAVRLAMLSAVASTPGVLAEPAPDAQIAAVGPGRARVVARGWVDTNDTPLGVTQSAALARAHAVVAAAEVETSASEPAAPESLEPGGVSSDE